MRTEWIAALGLAASVALLPAPATAQQWIEYGRAADDGFPLYYDPGRVRFRGAVAIVWTRNDNANPPLAGEGYRVSRMEIDCENETARTMYTAAYRPDGTVIATDQVPTRAQPIPPGTMVEALMERVCAGRS